MNYIKQEQKSFIHIITINRPEALNALSIDVLSELEEAVDSVKIDETRCVIITGMGEKAFVAGADIALMYPLSKTQAKEWSLNGNRIFRKIETLPVPVIAAVNGYALGGGCELAMACDIRLASETAIFAQPEVGLGVIAGFGGTQRLSRLVGVGKAKELLFTATRIKASEALAIGLVNAVYPAEALTGEAFKLAEKIAANAPIAVRATKKAVNEGLHSDIGSGIEIEAEQFGLCFETKDQKNAMAAFLEKRKPEPFVNA
ncbi:MAG: enoyl-CoA hydratase/isomerase family protein [Treponema sp.]|nr:enoyl-CoA hydratase/isomerase family protein [Treponema sp.]